MRIIFHSIALGLLLGGCQSQTGLTPRADQPTPQQQISDLQSRIDQQQQHIDELTDTLDTLRSFRSDRLKHIVHADAIAFGRYTRIENNKLILYLKILDSEGEFIKTYGCIEIELWNLSDQNIGPLQTWRFDVDQAGRYWLGAALAHHYKFELPLPPAAVKVTDSLTLQATFTDPLTGRTLHAQKLLIAN